MLFEGAERSLALYSSLIQVAYGKIPLRARRMRRACKGKFPSSEVSAIYMQVLCGFWYAQNCSRTRDCHDEDMIFIDLGRNLP